MNHAPQYIHSLHQVPLCFLKAGEAQITSKSLHFVVNIISSSSIYHRGRYIRYLERNMYYFYCILLPFFAEYNLNTITGFEEPIS
jgi:hypothetical protein